MLRAGPAPQPQPSSVCMEQDLIMLDEDRCMAPGEGDPWQVGCICTDLRARVRHLGLDRRLSSVPRADVRETVHAFVA